MPEDDFVDAAMNQLDTWHDRSHMRQYREREWRAMLGRHGFHVERSELYTKHRPLTSLTKDVCEDDVALIAAFLQGLNAAERDKLNLVTRDGAMWINHWYVMLAAEAV